MVISVIVFRNTEIFLCCFFPFILSSYVVEKVKFKAEPSHNSKVGKICLWFQMHKS